MNKKIYKISISSFAKGRHYKYGEFTEIIDKHGKVYNSEYGESNYYNIMHSATNEIDSIKMKVTEYHGSKPRLYPNFLQINLIYVGIDPTAIQFLDTNSISYKTYPINILNDSSVNYRLVVFPSLQIQLFDLVASNAVVADGYIKIKGQSYPASVADLTLTSKSSEINSIVSMKEYPTALLCDEDTKIKLEKSKLTGFSLREMKIAD